jgi:O2-independent ubiquinone biosynthesis accessory factor UbiT
MRLEIARHLALAQRSADPTGHVPKMSEVTSIPGFPAPLRLLLSPVPLQPLRLVMRRFAEELRRRRPELFARIDVHASKVFLIDPTDLPFAFRLRPDPDCPMIEPVRRFDAAHWDARIAGPFAALIGMVHGAFDGDALFFSRDIVIEGDTEAVLALRNAIDDAEMDLAAEVAATFGIDGTPVGTLARVLLPSLSRLTGVALMRVDGS